MLKAIVFKLFKVLHVLHCPIVDNIEYLKKKLAAFWGPFEIVFLFQGLGNTMGQPLNFTAGIIDARAAVQTTVQPPKQTTVQVNKSALPVISLSLTYMYDITFI